MQNRNASSQTPGWLNIFWERHRQSNVIPWRGMVKGRTRPADDTAYRTALNAYLNCYSIEEGALPRRPHQRLVPARLHPLIGFGDVRLSEPTPGAGIKFNSIHCRPLSPRNQQTGRG